MIKVILVLTASLLFQREQELEYQEYIEEICEERSICPEVIWALIERESRWDAEAYNAGCDAVGLMQIVPKWQTARMEALGITYLYDPKQNILLGINYLGDLCDEYGSMEEALMFYNMGYRGIELYEQGITSNYASSILNRAMVLEKRTDDGRNYIEAIRNRELRFRENQESFR